MSRWADWRGMGSYGTVGLEMVLSVLFGLFVGRWLGDKAGSATWGALIGFGFGVAAAVRALLQAQRLMKRQTDADGFKDSSTDRPARFELDEKQRSKEGDALRSNDASQQRRDRAEPRATPRASTADGADPPADPGSTPERPARNGVGAAPAADRHEDAS